MGIYRSQAYACVHTAPFQYAMVALPFQDGIPILCVTSDTLETALLGVAAAVCCLHTFDDSSSQSSLPSAKCIEDMEQVHDDVVLLLLHLVGQMFTQPSIGYWIEWVQKKFGIPNTADKRVKVNLLCPMEKIFSMSGLQQYVQGRTTASGPGESAWCGRTTSSWKPGMMRSGCRTSE